MFIEPNKHFCFARLIYECVCCIAMTNWLCSKEKRSGHTGNFIHSDYVHVHHNKKKTPKWSLPLTFNLNQFCYSSYYLVIHSIEFSMLRLTISHLQSSMNSELKLVWCIFNNQPDVLLLAEKKQITNINCSLFVIWYEIFFMHNLTNRTLIGFQDENYSNRREKNL